jgi:hypothetical protein
MELFLLQNYAKMGHRNVILIYVIAVFLGLKVFPQIAY